MSDAEKKAADVAAALARGKDDSKKSKLLEPKTLVDITSDGGAVGGVPPSGGATPDLARIFKQLEETFIQGFRSIVLLAIRPPVARTCKKRLSWTFYA